MRRAKDSKIAAPAELHDLPFPAGRVDLLVCARELVITDSRIPVGNKEFPLMKARPDGGFG